MFAADQELCGSGFKRKVPDCLMKVPSAYAQDAAEELEYESETIKIPPIHSHAALSGKMPTPRSPTNRHDGDDEPPRLRPLIAGWVELAGTMRADEHTEAPICRVPMHWRAAWRDPASGCGTRITIRQFQRKVNA